MYEHTDYSVNPFHSGTWTTPVNDNSFANAMAVNVGTTQTAYGNRMLGSSDMPASYVKDLAGLASAAYLSPSDRKTFYQHVYFYGQDYTMAFEAGETEPADRWTVYVPNDVHAADSILVVFRGTSTDATDLQQDVSLIQDSNVQYSTLFNTETEAVRAVIERADVSTATPSNTRRKVVYVGHSLGGPKAIYASWHLKDNNPVERVVTFNPFVPRDNDWWVNNPSAHLANGNAALSAAASLWASQLHHYCVCGDWASRTLQLVHLYMGTHAEAQISADNQAMALGTMHLCPSPTGNDESAYLTSNADSEWTLAENGLSAVTAMMSAAWQQWDVATDVHTVKYFISDSDRDKMRRNMSNYAVISTKKVYAIGDAARQTDAGQLAHSKLHFCGLRDPNAANNQDLPTLFNQSGTIADSSGTNHVYDDDSYKWGADHLTPYDVMATHQPLRITNYKYGGTAANPHLQYVIVLLTVPGDATCNYIAIMNLSAAAASTPLIVGNAGAGQADTWISWPPANQYALDGTAVKFLCGPVGQGATADGNATVLSTSVPAQPEPMNYVGASDFLSMYFGQSASVSGGVTLDHCKWHIAQDTTAPLMTNITAANQLGTAAPAAGSRRLLANAIFPINPAPAAPTVGAEIEHGKKYRIWSCNSAYRTGASSASAHDVFLRRIVCSTGTTFGYTAGTTLGDSKLAMCVDKSTLTSSAHDDEWYCERVAGTATIRLYAGSSSGTRLKDALMPVNDLGSIHSDPNIPGDMYLVHNASGFYTDNLANPSSGFNGYKIQGTRDDSVTVMVVSEQSYWSSSTWDPTAGASVSAVSAYSGTGQVWLFEEVSSSGIP